ncbi:MAG: extracellular solute-binding protein [Actinomycetota bacterium]|nr:extracellular solute-binding protein [Acidimicrobiales bacterium]MEC7899248.1 extracellular solute-binding protein [Actinomycetota bacterium]|tara:strand:- start:1195 stop:2274 length:1080 start_codon:yes stop_codon:yes gene_type:complete
MKTKPKIILSSLICLAFLSASCSSSSNKREELSERAAEIVQGDCASDAGKEVTIYSGRSEYLISPILEAFACETGIDVRVRWGNSTDLAILINEEGKSTEADVFLSRSPGPVGFLEGNELLGTIDGSVLSLVEEQNHAASGSWIGFSGRKRVLVYNVDQVKPDELPNSVFDLTDPVYKNRVAIPGTNGSFEDWFTVFRDQHGNETATKWLNDMVENDAKYYPNNRSIVEAAGRGEIDMGLVNHYYNYQEAAALGSEHRAVNYDFPSDDIGSLLIITAATILETAKDKDASNELIAYLLTPQAQDYFSNRTFEYPLAKGSKPNSILPALEALEIGSVDFDSLGGGFEETERIVRESGILN